MSSRSRMLMLYSTGSLCFFLFLALLSTRDIRLIMSLRQSNLESNEFAEVAYLCDSFPRCFRVTPSIVGSTLTDALTWITKQLSFNPDPFGSVPVVLAERILFSEHVIAFLFRLGCALLIWHFVRKMIGSLILTNLTLSLFLFLLISPQSLILDSLTTRIEFLSSELTWLSQMLIMYFIYYDFFVIVGILLIHTYHPNLAEKSVGFQFLIGAILFLTFEYLPIFYCLLLIFSPRTSFKPRQLFALLPGILLVLWSVTINNDKSGNNTAEIFAYYFWANLTNPLGVLVITGATLFPPLVFGYLLQRFLRSYLEIKALDTLYFHGQVIRATTKALVLVHGLSLFTSGVTSEFGRQSLSLQLFMLLTGMSLNTVRKSSKFNQQ